MSTLRQHLRVDHDFEYIVRGSDPERLHEMAHKAERRRDGETHTHADEKNAVKR